MFEGPEHEPYLALCREMRLERNLGEGDYYGQFYSGEMVASLWDGSVLADEAAWWLPRLDQWLAMLGAAGVRNIGFWTGDDYAKCGALLQVSPYEGWDPGDLETASTREEAAARLWCALTGRTVPA